MAVALWRVDGSNAPSRLTDHRDFLEKHFETWIESDPSLVVEGLKWVGRQCVLPDSTRLDLLGITPEGQWVVAELKAGPVSAATLMQAFGYAMHIGTMKADDLLELTQETMRDEVSRHALGEASSPRPVMILLIGTSQQPDLDRGLQFLEERGLNLPIRIVTFGVFRDVEGRVILCREVAERDDVDPLEARSGIQKVLDLAGDHGVRDELSLAIQIAGRLGLRTRSWPYSITIQSPSNPRQTLLYLAPIAGGARLGYATERFDEALGVTATDLSTALGKNWRDVVPKSEVRAWLQRAEELIRSAQVRSKTAVDAVAAIPRPPAEPLGAS